MLATTWVQALKPSINFTIIQPLWCPRLSHKLTLLSPAIIRCLNHILYVNIMRCFYTMWDKFSIILLPIFQLYTITFLIRLWTMWDGFTILLLSIFKLYTISFLIRLWTMWDGFMILLLPIFKLYAISFLMKLCFLHFHGSHHRSPPLPDPLFSKLLNIYGSLSLFWIIFLKKHQIEVVNFVNIKIKIIFLI